MQNGSFQGKKGPKFINQRKIELIPKEQLDYYDNPGESLSRYFTSMLTHIETVKFAGRAAPKINTQNGNVEYEWDDLSTIGKTLSEIANDPNIPEDKQQEIMRSFPAIFRALMNKSSQVESPIFSWFRQFTYLSLLVSPTATLSQLYDLPFIMIENGFFKTLGGIFGKKDFNIADYMDVTRIQEEFRTEMDMVSKAGKMNAKMIQFLQFGLKAMGFTKLDQIMKNTNMNMNLQRYTRLANYVNNDGTIKNNISESQRKQATKFLSELELYIGKSVLGQQTYDRRGNEISNFLIAIKTKHQDRTADQKALIGSTLVRKLFENQPLTELRMPLSVANNPNARAIYTMKSFMIVQLNSFNQQTIQRIKRGMENGDGEEIKEGFRALFMMLAYFMMIGVPVDMFKDLIMGRTGYMSDYFVNSSFRVFGVNKYHFYQMKREGLGRTLLDFSLPVPVMRFIDVTEQMGDVTAGTFYKMEEMPFADAFGYQVQTSRVLTNIPFLDILQYRFPEQRKKQRKRIEDRKKQAEKEDRLRYGLEMISPEPFAPTLAAFESFAPFGEAE